MAERGVPISCFLAGFAFRLSGSSLRFVVTVERLDRCGFRLPVIISSMQSGMLFRRLDSCLLWRGSWDVFRLRCGLFLRGGLGRCAARAVKAGAAAGFVDDLFVDVGVANHTCVHPGHGRVIAERIANPFAAVVALSSVAVAVIDPAVEPDSRAPVAVVEEVIAAVVAPVSGGPQESDAWRRDPDAGDPVIIGIVAPVARGPNIAFGWAVGLLIYRYRRWRDPNRYADLCKRRSQRKPYKEKRRERNGREFHFHIRCSTSSNKRRCRAAKYSHPPRHSRSGGFVQDRLHLGAGEGPHCLRADVAQPVRR